MKSSSNKDGGSIGGSGMDADAVSGGLSVGSEASDQINGAFRFLLDYRLAAYTPGGVDEGGGGSSSPSRSHTLGRSSRSQCSSAGSASASASASVTSASVCSVASVGASLAASGGVGAPPHTPMGSTTRLIADPVHASRHPKKGCRCPSLGVSSIAAALSLAASLANVVRLPGLVLSQGQGSGSLVAVYVGLCLVLGVPLVFLEVLLGQFCQEGVTKLWRAVPLLKGIGFVQVMASILASVYYPVLISVALFYALWIAKSDHLPFAECDTITHVFTQDVQFRYFPLYQMKSTTNRSWMDCLEETLLTPLDKDPMWFGVNTALLIIVWVLLMICVCCGSRSFRVSASLLLLAVVAALSALLIQQLNISYLDLEKYFQVDLKYIFKFDTWYLAVVQLFLSTQLSFGNITTMSGRMYSKRNAFWISLLFMVCHLAIGLGFTCLACFWHQRLGPAAAVPNPKPQLPELYTLTLAYNIATHFFSQDHNEFWKIWAIIPFFAVVCAGLISLMATVFTVTTTVIVESKEKWRSWVIAAGFSFICFLSGIICLLPEKLELVHMLENYVISRLVVVSAAVQLIGFAWIYGTHHLYNDFEFVLGYKLTVIWNFIWSVAPLLILVLEIWSAISMPLTATSGQPDPEWLYLTGYATLGAACLMVLVVSIWQITMQVDYNAWQKFVSSLKPSRNWGPVDPIQRHGWVVWREQCTLSGERDFTLKRRGTRDYTHKVRQPLGTLGGTRYSPQDDKMAIHDTLTGSFTINSLPNYNSTQATDVNMRAIGSPYVVQLPDNREVDHVCWRRDHQVPR